MNDCVFCKIIKKEIPCYKIYENEFVLAILPKDMEVYGHTLIIPKKHCVNLYDIDEETLQELISIVKKLTIQYKETI
jgi:histidine triad (HIT) family protein